jgi:glutamate--cysteine ligase
MAAYFDALADPMGPVMMTSTASVQVNLDIGTDRADASRRWRLLHALGPTLVAAFANSPLHAGADTGWKSARQRVWQRLDRCRTAAPGGTGPGDDPATAWTTYSLDAQVMLRHREDGDWRVEPGLTLRDWLEQEDAPSAADLGVHLSTLFPPVRPRGWFEVRYLDAQPWRWWPVPMAVLTALLEDRVASGVAALACAGLDDWTSAARDGLAAPGLQEAAARCFDAALAALVRTGEHADLVALVAAFADRYVHLGRSPADDPLEVA